MCGEKITLHIRANVSLGSPPHVRGKADTMRAVHRMQRITPAHAGKSYIWAGTTTPLTDHPRVCGEKQLRQAIAVQHIGSPPHVRGKGTGALKDRRHVRITPAYAGKSALRQRLPVAGEDHPRVCGEKRSSVLTSPSCTGSPPHVRGKVKEFACRASDTRITPACAGKSDIAPVSPIGVSGSPPHMRGKEEYLQETESIDRITPAHAGKSDSDNV